MKGLINHYIISAEKEKPAVSAVTAKPEATKREDVKNEGRVFVVLHVRPFISVQYVVLKKRCSSCCISSPEWIFHLVFSFKLCAFLCCQFKINGLIVS